MPNDTNESIIRGEGDLRELIKQYKKFSQNEINKGRPKPSFPEYLRMIGEKDIKRIYKKYLAISEDGYAENFNYKSDIVDILVDDKQSILDFFLTEYTKKNKKRKKKTKAKKYNTSGIVGGFVDSNTSGDASVGEGLIPTAHTQQIGDEVQMITTQLNQLIADANDLLSIMMGSSKDVDISAWQQNKITKAVEFIATVKNSIKFGDKNKKITLIDMFEESDFEELKRALNGVPSNFRNTSLYDHLLQKYNITEEDENADTVLLDKLDSDIINGTSDLGEGVLNKINGAKRKQPRKKHLSRIKAAQTTRMRNKHKRS